MKTTKNELKQVVQDYAPHALGVISGGMAVLCLWITAALCKIEGAGLVAFATLSGAVFWFAGAALAVLVWLDREDRAECERKKAELRAQLYGGRTA